MNRNELKDDIKLLLGYWFCALEDEGSDPWTDKECLRLSRKYGYTKKDYQKYLQTVY